MELVSHPETGSFLVCSLGRGQDFKKMQPLPQFADDLSEPILGPETVLHGL